MNLEVIAMRRAEEQRASFRWEEEPKPDQRVRVARDRSLSKRPLLCNCGTCRRCKNRISMRRNRKENRAPGGRRGSPIDKTRVCVRCKGPINVLNRSGYCKACTLDHGHWKWDRIGKRQGFYSHGGGI